MVTGILDPHAREVASPQHWAINSDRINSSLSERSSRYIKRTPSVSPKVQSSQGARKFEHACGPLLFRAVLGGQLDGSDDRINLQEFLGKLCGHIR